MHYLDERSSSPAKFLFLLAGIVVFLVITLWGNVFFEGLRFILLVVSGAWVAVALFFTLRERRTSVL